MVGAFLILLGTYLLAGEYLLGKKRLKKLEERLNKLANSTSYFSLGKKFLMKPPKGWHPVRPITWKQQRHRLIISGIVTSISVLVCAFFIGKALSKFLPMYLNIPITVFSAFAIWFYTYWVSLNLEFLLLQYEISGAQQIPRWIFILVCIIWVITHPSKNWAFYGAVAIFYRYTIDISLFPLKKIKLFARKHNLGYLTALLGALLVTVGVILEVISGFIPQVP